MAIVGTLVPLAESSGRVAEAVVVVETVIDTEVAVDVTGV
jgi:hypothetical protein